MNFVYGNNGNGKTNLLEAISFLCFTRSFMHNSESDCVKYGSDEFDISGVFINSLNVSNKVSLRFDAAALSKKFTLNGESVGRLSSFFGSYPLVVLAPQDMKLTGGTPAERRRNFDILISQVSRLYFDDLKNYNKVIKQKNALLKDNLSYIKYPPKELQRLLEPWNEEIASLGSKIMLRRIAFVKEFKPYLDKNFLEIVGNAYEPTLSYKSDTELRESESGLSESIFSQMILRFHDELSRGMALAGPHRDNYEFGMRKDGNEFDVRTFASQGEHKTYIVSLKFAEYSYLNEKLSGAVSGEPVLLLDDIFSDLDGSRISKICSILPEHNQVFLTTTNPDHASKLREYFTEANMSLYKVENGIFNAS